MSTNNDDAADYADGYGGEYYADGDVEGASDDEADSQVDDYVISTGLRTEFLLEDVGEPPGEDSDPSGPVSEAVGDVYLAIDSAEQRVVSVSFHIAGVSAAGGGIFDLQGQQSDQQSDDNNGWIKDDWFVLDVEAVYLDEYIVANSPLDEVTAHVFESQRDFYRGQLRGKLTVEGEMIILRETWLTLAALPEQRQYGKVRALRVRVATSRGQQRKRTPCSARLVKVYPKHLQLEVVHFAPRPGETGQTGAASGAMLGHAQQLWQPGLIDWQVAEPAANSDFTLADLNPTDNNHLTTLYNSRTRTDPGWIPIFFVRFDLSASGHGGGFTSDSLTANAQTALAAIAISENACNLALAHELGHVMGGLHFSVTMNIPGYWRADAHTILSPPLKARNSRRNCASATKPMPGTAAQSVPQCLPADTWAIAGHPGCP